MSINFHVLGSLDQGPSNLGDDLNNAMTYVDQLKTSILICLVSTKFKK